MRRRWPISGIAAVIVVLVACGQQIDTSGAPTPSSDAAAAPDGGSSVSDGGVILDGGSKPDEDASDANAGPPCNLAADFQEAKVVDGIEGVNTMFVASLTADERTLYYDSASVGAPMPTSKIYRAERTSRTAAFGSPATVSALNIGSTGRLALSGDGLHIAFFTDQSPAGVRIASRSFTSEEFTAPQKPSFVTGAGVAQFAAFSFDASLLYYEVGPNGGVFASTRHGSDYPPGAPVPGLTTEDRPPHVIRDGTTAYFTRVSATAIDIFRATRSSAGVFSSVTREVGTVNTADEEHLSFVSWDGCRLYFNRRKPGTSNSASLFVVEKPVR